MYAFGSVTPGTVGTYGALGHRKRTVRLFSPYMRGSPISRSLPLSQDCSYISPELTYELVCTSSTDRESLAFTTALLLKAIGSAIRRIRKFVGEPVHPALCTNEICTSQSGCDAALKKVLSRCLCLVASYDVVGVPRYHRMGMRRQVFHKSSWWIRDAPHLPLSTTTTQARALAWYLYWFTEWE